MKKLIIIISLILGVVLFSLFVASQLDLSKTPITTVESLHTFISAKIDLVKEETCTTTFFDEEQPIYDSCAYYRNFTSCLNTTGPNTDCSSQQSVSAFQCRTGSESIARNRTECIPNKEFIIEIIEGETTLRKKIDYSDWGPCINEVQGSCLVVTCVSNEDGAFKGQFTNCNGGKSCQKFEICDDGIKSYYKNSREDFTEDDPSFFLGRLQVEEVGQ